MSNVSVEVSGDGGNGGVRIVGGDKARFPRSGIRVHGDPTGPGTVVSNGRVYGPVKAEMGELSDGDYGIALVNSDGQLTKLEDFIFGPKVAQSDFEDGGLWVGRVQATASSQGYKDLTLINTSTFAVGGTYVGPEVDVMIGETGRALIQISCRINWNVSATATPNVFGLMSVALSGANTLGADEEWSCHYRDDMTVSGATIARNGHIKIGSSYLFEGLDPGLTTFTCKYRPMLDNEHVVSGTPEAFFDKITLAVFPY